MVEIKTFHSKDDEQNEFIWINLIRPKKSEFLEFAHKYNIPNEFFTDPLDIDERARIDAEKDVTLCILRVPTRGTTETAPFITVPLGIIITKNVLITVCAIPALSTKQLHKDIYAKDLNSINTFFYILRATALYYLQYLKDINSQTMIIEKELQASLKNQELVSLLAAEKSLVYFTTSLRSNEIMFNRLQNFKSISPYISTIDFEDILIEYRQAIEMANVYSNILSGMMDAFASIISNNLNVVMKILTSITIVLMLPTLVASFYGMN
ncbi:MAG: magnesium transporter CorA family protein, partial [Candidatus Marinimicrobia bacterium]|nr:magnesium transporter CorA family protein [Candidatus Neomarinimicrobiota bacterium]